MMKIEGSIQVWTEWIKSQRNRQIKIRGKMTGFDASKDFLSHVFSNYFTLIVHFKQVETFIRLDRQMNGWTNISIPWAPAKKGAKDWHELPTTSPYTPQHVTFFKTYTKVLFKHKNWNGFIFKFFFSKAFLNKVMDICTDIDIVTKINNWLRT